jgi:PIN domain nuclease of toxin-antitoxin system
LSGNARQHIAQSIAVSVSAITAFEIGVKHAKGKLRLPSAPSRWVETALRLHDISVCPIDHRIALRATELPPIHGDPCDRLIIATAQMLGYPIITTDTKFKLYEVTTIA